MSAARLRPPYRLVSTDGDGLVVMSQVLGADDVVQLGVDLARLAEADPQHAPVRAEVDR